MILVCLAQDKGGVLEIFNALMSYPGAKRPPTTSDIAEQTEKLIRVGEFEK